MKHTTYFLLGFICAAIFVASVAFLICAYYIKHERIKSYTKGFKDAFIYIRKETNRSQFRKVSETIAMIYLKWKKNAQTKTAQN